MKQRQGRKVVVLFLLDWLRGAGSRQHLHADGRRSNVALKRMTAVLGLALTALAPPAVGFTMRDRLLSPAIVPVPDTAAPAGPDAMLPARSAAIVRDVAPVDENPALYQPVAGWDYNPSDLNGGSSGFPLSALTVNQTLGRAR